MINNRKPNNIDERLNQLAAEGIEVVTLKRIVENDIDLSKRNESGYLKFSFGYNPIVGRFSDGSIEFISTVEKVKKNSFNIINGAFNYAVKEGFIKETDTEMNVEIHAIQEGSHAYFFVLPSREYLKQKPAEPNKPEGYQ
jgi:hypothetical protein